DVEIAVRLQRQIERAVPRDELEHVIEEADSRGNLVAAPALDRELQPDRRLARLAPDYRTAHNTSSSASTRRRRPASSPAVLLLQPSHPCSRDRSRTRMPRSASAATIALTRLPTRTS